MHPIERLRAVARAGGAPADAVVREAAASLARFAEDPVSLVTACRRLIDRHPANGAVWWLCSRVLSAPDPGDEAWCCLDDLVDDPTAREAAHALPPDARVVLVGPSVRLLDALTRRGDLDVAVVDGAGGADSAVMDLTLGEVPARPIDAARLAPVVAAADVVVLSSGAVVGDRALVEVGGWSAAAVARTAGVTVWVVTEVGALIPDAYRPALEARLEHREDVVTDRAGTASVLEALPLDLVDALVGPDGPESPATAMARNPTPVVAELSHHRGSTR